MEGKKIVVFFNDGLRVIGKHGLCLSYDNVFLTLKNDRGLTEILPVDKIQRIEFEKVQNEN